MGVTNDLLIGMILQALNTPNQQLSIISWNMFFFHKKHVVP